MKKYLSWQIIAIVIVALILGFLDLSPKWQKTILPFLSAEKPIVKNVNLGLDLQGGSQLDYKIDLRSVPEADQQSIVDGVLNVITKRVNGLGVAEPNIYTSKVGGETHIVVELAENANITQTDVTTYLGEGKLLADLTDDEKKLVSLEKAKETVGKTIQLEFKEKKDQIDPAEKDKIQQEADTTLSKILGGADFGVTGQEEQQAYPEKVKYEKTDFVFGDKIPGSIKDVLTKLQEGQINRSLVEISGNYTLDQTTGSMVEDKGLAVVKLDAVREEIKNNRQVQVSHILIAYKDAKNADASVTRTKDEAYNTAKEIKTKLEQEGDFAILAQQNSDDKSNKESGGKLDVAVSGDGTYVYDFEQAALKLQKDGDISDPVSTDFGYHIIKADKVETDVKEKQYQYETITYSLVPDPWKATGLTGKQFVHADVQLDSFYQPYITIKFNDEGAKLFEEITGRNVGKPVAIFVGGNLISSPNVNEKIAGGSAQITGKFTTDEANNLARDLNTGAIPAPIVLSGEHTIGATLGQESLSKSLIAGLITLILIMAFMAFFYRLPGLLANLSLLVYLAIYLFLLKAQLNLGIAIIIALIIFAFMIVKILNSHDHTWEKVLSFVLSCAAFFFLTFLLHSGVVLTLAGIAGIIISIGMAVDANVLIFERLKEELKTGKPYSAALEAAFHRAWNAIRDSNFNSLIVCAILFTFGSSIVKGFAFTLASGILVSMFTAITITRILMKAFIGKDVSQNQKLFGIKGEPPKIRFIEKSKLWLSISGASVVIALIAIFGLGLNLGFDFTGGTLMEFKFDKDITKDRLTKAFGEIEQEVNSGELAEISSAELSAADSATNETLVLSGPLADSTAAKVTIDKQTQIDLVSAKIMESGKNQFIVKTKYLTPENQAQVFAKMKEKLSTFNKIQSTTIGPVVGQSMLRQAIYAVIIAVLGILIYIGLAFRKVPKEVSPWRFSLCAIVALVHDVIVLTGIFAILGALFNAEADTLFITALLTVFGYSVHDTIIIFDRLRENMTLRSRDDKLEDVANNALNQTLARSINTTVTVLLSLIALLIFGSPEIFFFILALTIGIGVGTYSSIFVASPLLMTWHKWAANKKQMTK